MHSDYCLLHPLLSSSHPCHYCLPQITFPHLFLSILFSDPLNWTRVTSVTFGFRIIHWSLVGSLVSTQLKIRSPHTQNPSVQHEQVKPTMSSSTINDWLLTRPLFCRSIVGKQFCDFMIVISVPCPEDNFTALPHLPDFACFLTSIFSGPWALERWLK